MSNGCWLSPDEQKYAIRIMLEAGIIKMDNARKLPLKNGGVTDLYINIRDSRSSPQAIRALSELYANALRRLAVQRIIEVPEAVSPLAGHVSAITDIPLVTIREEEKAGRVVGGKFIGDIRPGDVVAIMDDVITDGKSKLAALSELQRVGAELAALVVMVDRQQGWRKKFDQAGYKDVEVWPAMTLHDVRRYLIETGMMQRCDPKVEEKNPIIVALDGKDWEDILPLLDQLRTSGCILKVNDLLVEMGIANLIPDLMTYGRVMADLKGHDIPNTVTNICNRLRKCPPWAVTVHASGGGEMIKAAKKALEGTPTKVLAVTVLTSLNEKSCNEIYHNIPGMQVPMLAEIAKEAGADGFVCSPQEVYMLSLKYPGMLYVTPGVRSPGTEAQDQERIDTPGNALSNGATHVVMGRQIMGAENPLAEVQRVLTQELGIV